MSDKTTTINTRFFRAGVGTVIYNQAGQVAFFKRAKYPIGVWQFQQGGIDLGEAVETTLWRELEEEVGLIKTDFLAVSEMPNWTIYQNPITISNHDENRLGQAHRWFFLELKPEVNIDLSQAKDEENSDWKWTTFSEAIAITDGLKKHVYQQLETYFLEFIKPRLS